MIPALQAVYDELLTRASSPPHDRLADAWRERFSAACGRYDANHAHYERRQAAAWEDALVRGGLAQQLADSFDDPEERRLARALARAERCVLSFELQAFGLLARDLWSEAQYLVIAGDHVARSVTEEMLRNASPIGQGYYVPSLDGISILPAIVFHPPDALVPITQCMAVAHSRQLGRDRTLDSLLGMEHRWQTLARVKVAYAYRPDQL